MKLNLARIYTEDDPDGNPQGFGPGVVEVPDWAVERLRARGVDVTLVQEEETPGQPADGLPENAPDLPPHDGSEGVLGVSVAGAVGLPLSPDATGNVLTAPADGIEKTAIEVPADGVEREIELNGPKKPATTSRPR